MKVPKEHNDDIRPVRHYPGKTGQKFPNLSSLLLVKPQWGSTYQPSGCDAPPPASLPWDHREEIRPTLKAVASRRISVSAFPIAAP